MRETYKKMLLYFFLAMMVCTVVSRAADSLTVPQVSVQRPGSGKLEYQIKGKGTIEITKKKTYLIPEGYLVEQCKSDGSSVKKGDVLVQFQMDQVKQKKQESALALEKAQVTLEQSKLGVQQDAWVPQTQAAQRALENARQDLAKEQQQQPVTGGFSVQTEDQETQMEEPQSDESALELKKNAVRDAQGAYEDAQKSDDATRQNAFRSQQNAAFTVKLQELDVKEAKKNFEAANRIWKDKGCIKAKKEGIFFNSLLQAGSVTNGSEYISIGSDGYALLAEISKEEMEKLAIGDHIQVKMNGAEEMEVEIDGLTQQQKKETEGKENLEEAQEEKETYLLHATLPEQGTTYHPTASFSIEKRSEEDFDFVLPKTAIRQDQKGYFCLCIQESDSILGETLQAKRVELKLEQEAEDEVAVSGALDADTEVIVSSEKDIQEKGRVRIGE